MALVTTYAIVFATLTLSLPAMSREIARFVARRRRYAPSAGSPTVALGWRPRTMMLEMLEERALLALHPLTDIPSLNSHPGAFIKLYLDFDGDITPTWGAESPGTTPAYDVDGDATTFSDAELTNIGEIWARVAEKFSPFNMNVTTVDPGNLNDDETVQVVIGGNGAWHTPSAGGIAFQGSFFNGESNKAFVFAGLSPSDLKFLAEGSAHEAGHTFGLSHQSVWSGMTKTDEYNPGDSLKAPIMGAAAGSARGLWWLGTSSADPAAIQDDLAVLDDHLPYRNDDHGNTAASASPTNVIGKTQVAAGVIEKTSDVDAFSFTTSGGMVTIVGNVPAIGPTLDLKLTLTNAAGAVIQAADTSTLGEGITAFLPAGSYRVLVGSHGAYGDIGTYSLTVETDSTGPQVTSVTITGNPAFNLFSLKPSTSGPTPLVNSLSIGIRDLPPRFSNIPAIDTATFHPGFFEVRGDANGIVAIGSAVFVPDAFISGQPATGNIVLTFAGPLPDDRYTLTVLDSLTDPSGNKLDGESTAAQPGTPTFPTGNSVPGGNFVARFTVDSRPEVGFYFGHSIVVDINGNGFYDPNNLDATNRDLTFQFGSTNFQRFAVSIGPGSFDLLAAYGRIGDTFHVLVDITGDGAFQVGEDIGQLSINGLAGNGDFDGNRNNGDEGFVFDGVTWFLDPLALSLPTPTTVKSAIQGYPIVGDFDGDGFDDLATYQKDQFFFDLFANGFGNFDGFIKLTTPGVLDRPVAADMNGDGVDDLGIWNPGGNVSDVTQWMFLTNVAASIQPPGTLNAPDYPFVPGPFGNDLLIYFGSTTGLPIVGNFDPPVAAPAPLVTTRAPRDEAEQPAPTAPRLPDAGAVKPVAEVVVLPAESVLVAPKPPSETAVVQPAVSIELPATHSKLQLLPKKPALAVHVVTPVVVTAQPPAKSPVVNEQLEVKPTPAVIPVTEKAAKFRIDLCPPAESIAEPQEQGHLRETAPAETAVPTVVPVVAQTSSRGDSSPANETPVAQEQPPAPASVLPAAAVDLAIAAVSDEAALQSARNAVVLPTDFVGPRLPAQLPVYGPLPPAAAAGVNGGPARSWEAFVQMFAAASSAFAAGQQDGANGAGTGKRKNL